jgi:hypothetical protein
LHSFCLSGAQRKSLKEVASVSEKLKEKTGLERHVMRFLWLFAAVLSLSCTAWNWCAQLIAKDFASLVMTLDSFLAAA